MNNEFIPTTVTIHAYLVRPFISFHQYKNANAIRHHPPETRTNELVAILLMIGVIVAPSMYPAANNRVPASNNHFNFKTAGLFDNKREPAIIPQMVWHAVGIKLMVTQPPLLILCTNKRSI